MKYCPICASKLLDHFVSQEKKYLKCSNETCKFTFYNNPIPVVAAIVEHFNDLNESNIVLVRAIGWPKKFYGLVSGFLEFNEDPKMAIKREIEEELGIKEINEINLIGLYPFKEMNQLLIIYHVTIKGEIKLNLNELEDYKLIKKEKLKPWKFGTGKGVEDFLKLSKKGNNQSKL